MFSWPGRVAIVLVTIVFIGGEINASNDPHSTAPVGMGFAAILYVIVLAVILVVDFVTVSVIRSRRAVRRAEENER